jgi:hypothetical protein
LETFVSRRFYYEDAHISFAKTPLKTPKKSMLPYELEKITANSYAKNSKITTETNINLKTTNLLWQLTQRKTLGKPTKNKRNHKNQPATCYIKRKSQQSKR